MLHHCGEKLSLLIVIAQGAAELLSLLIVIALDKWGPLSILRVIALVTPELVGSDSYLSEDTTIAITYNAVTLK
jgi:hypothetical protein